MPNRLNFKIAIIAILIITGLSSLAITFSDNLKAFLLGGRLAQYNYSTYPSGGTYNSYPSGSYSYPTNIICYPDNAYPADHGCLKQNVTPSQCYTRTGISGNCCWSPDRVRWLNCSEMTSFPSSPPPPPAPEQCQKSNGTLENCCFDNKGNKYPCSEPPCYKKDGAVDRCCTDSNNIKYACSEPPVPPSSQTTTTTSGTTQSTEPTNLSTQPTTAPTGTSQQQVSTTSGQTSPTTTPTPTPTPTPTTTPTSTPIDTTTQTNPNPNQTTSPTSSTIYQNPSNTPTPQINTPTTPLSPQPTPASNTPQQQITPSNSSGAATASNSSGVATPSEAPSKESQTAPPQSFPATETILERNCLETNLIEKQCFEPQYLEANKSKFIDFAKCTTSECTTYTYQRSKCIEYGKKQGADKDYWINEMNALRCLDASYLRRTYAEKCTFIPQFNNTEYLKTLCFQWERKGELPELPATAISPISPSTPATPNIPATKPPAISQNPPPENILEDCNNPRFIERFRDNSGQFSFTNSPNYLRLRCFEYQRQKQKTAPQNKPQTIEEKCPTGDLNCIAKEKEKNPPTFVGTQGSNPPTNTPPYRPAPNTPPGTPVPPSAGAIPAPTQTTIKSVPIPSTPNVRPPTPRLNPKELKEIADDKQRQLSEYQKQRDKMVQQKPTEFHKDIKEITIEQMEAPKQFDEKKEIFKLKFFEKFSQPEVIPPPPPTLMPAPESTDTTTQTGSGEIPKPAAEPVPDFQKIEEKALANIEDKQQKQLAEFEENLNKIFQNAEAEIQKRQEELKSNVINVIEQIEERLEKVEKLRQESEIVLQDARAQMQNINEKITQAEEKHEAIMERPEKEREFVIPKEVAVDQTVVELGEKMKADEGTIPVIINFKEDKITASQRAIIERIVGKTENINSEKGRATVEFTPEQLQQYMALAHVAGATQILEDAPTRLWIDTSAIFLGSAAVIDNLGFTGKGITVAVLDTGIAADHPCLKGRVSAAKDFTGEGPGDFNGHGTHVAGIIGCNDELYRGNAPDVQFLDAKVMQADGSGKMSYAIDAIDWATENGANIINVSLGAKSDTCGQDALSQAVEAAIKKGIIVITAIGNFGPDQGTAAAPGCAESAITVGAVDETGKIAKFSSQGPTPFGVDKPNIYAPGVDITSSWFDKGFAVVNGTSQAAPHVAGITALLLEANPSLTPDEVKNIFIKTADPISGDNHGIINAYNAVYLYSGLQKDEKVLQEQTQKQNEAKTTASQKKAADTEITNDKLTPQEVELRISNKAAADLREAREQLKTCIIDAKSDEQAKSTCSAKFLKTQIRLQKQKLTSSEKEVISQLEEKALEVNKLTPDAATDYQETLKKISSSLYYTVFTGTNINDINEQASVLITALKDKKELKEVLTNLIKKYFAAKTASENEMYTRNLIPAKDVAPNTWYLSYVEDAKKRNIISGYRDANNNPTGDFGPANHLTIAEGIKIALEGAKLGASSSTESPKNPNTSNHWARAYFKKAEELNLTLVKDTNLDPNRDIKRGEFVQLLVETLKIPTMPTYENIFQDINLELDETTYIYTAYALGIISGDSNANTVRPNDAILRAEAAKTMVEALELTGL